MEIRIEPVPAAQKSVLRQMLELYLYDFSEFSKEDLAENGYFGYTYLDAYWQEAGRFPFFIRADGRLAGLSWSDPAASTIRCPTRTTLPNFSS